MAHCLSTVHNFVNVQQDRCFNDVNIGSRLLLTTDPNMLFKCPVPAAGRAIRETHMNQASSRSHSIFQIVVEQKRRSEEDGERVLRSKFNLVDLAG